MSKESIQFTEMIRRYFSAPAPTDRRMYCQRCGTFAPHIITEHGREETCVCSKCGFAHSYTVR